MRAYSIIQRRGASNRLFLICNCVYYGKQSMCAHSSESVDRVATILIAIPRRSDDRIILTAHACTVFFSLELYRKQKKKYVGRSIERFWWVTLGQRLTTYDHINEHAIQSIHVKTKHNLNDNQLAVRILIQRELTADVTLWVARTTTATIALAQRSRLVTVDRQYSSMRASRSHSHTFERNDFDWAAGSLVLSWLPTRAVSVTLPRR